MIASKATAETSVSSASDYFADVQMLLFLENSLFFYLSVFFSCTPHFYQTNVDSHIFVLMYVDDKIVTWTVINNVNMFSFLNKDFNKIASNERTDVVFIAV